MTAIAEVVASSQGKSSGLAAALTRSLFCGFRQGEQRMAVVVAFSDETEVAKYSRFFMGGYVAPEEDWPSVKAAWQERVLD